MSGVSTVVRPFLKVSAALTVLAVLPGCGFGPLAGGTECAPVATRVGVGLDIEPPFAERVDRAEMEICWAGNCRSPEVELFPASTSVPQECEDVGGDDPADAACGAVAVPTGGLHGFGDLPELPARPVQVSVSLRDASGRVVLEDEIELTPKRSTPRGRQCGDDGLQAGVVVVGGRLSARS